MRKKRRIILISLASVAVLIGSFWLYDERNISWRNAPESDISIDNPTGQKFFVQIDGGHRYPVTPYTFLSQIPLEYSRGANPVHHFVVMDSTGRVIADTSSKVFKMHTVLNPSRSTYVFWNLYYGDGSAKTENEIKLGGRSFTGDLRTDNNLLVNNQTFNSSYDDIYFHTERKVWLSMEERSGRDVMHYFFRAADFTAWYDFIYGNDFSEEFARTDLHNLLVRWHNLMIPRLKNKDTQSLDFRASPAGQAMEDIGNGRFNEVSVAKLVEQTRAAGYSPINRVIDSIQQLRLMVEQEAPKKNGNALEQKEKWPPLSPLTIVRYAHGVEGTWPLRRFCESVYKVEAWEAAQRFHEIDLPEYPLKNGPRNYEQDEK